MVGGVFRVVVMMCCSRSYTRALFCCGEVPRLPSRVQECMSAPRGLTDRGQAWCSVWTAVSVHLVDLTARVFFFFPSPWLVGIMNLVGVPALRGFVLDLPSPELGRLCIPAALVAGCNSSGTRKLREGALGNA